MLFLVICLQKKHLLSRHKSLLNVLEEILLVLNSDGESDEVIVDTGGLSGLDVNTSVGHGGGDLTERLDSAKRLGKSEDLGRLAELVGSLGSALDSERDHATTKTVSVLSLDKLPSGVGLETGVVDGLDEIGLLEELGNGLGVVGSGANSDVEGLDTSVGEPRVKGRGDGANGVLEEPESLVDHVGVGGSDTHDNVRVAVDVLGHGVHDNVGSEGQGVLDVGGEEGVVDDEVEGLLGGSGLVGLLDDGGHLGNVGDSEGGVRGGLDPHESGLGPDQRLELLLDGVGEGGLDAVGVGDLGEVSVGASVDVANGHNVGALGE